MVIEHLTQNGVVDPGILYDSPFTDQSPDGPDGVFEDRQVEQFLASLRILNQSATADAKAEVG
jgi:type I restriction enzyme R subunit